MTRYARICMLAVAATLVAALGVARAQVPPKVDTLKIAWMYSDPAALKMYSEWAKIPEAITKRMRDEFYPETELLPDRLAGIEAITEEALAFKFIKAPLSKAQLKELFVYSKAFD